MRDPARIDRLLALLRRYWHAHPDLSLWAALNGLPEFRYVESDDVLEAALRRELEAQRVPDGTPGVRDADAPCKDFTPGAPAGNRCNGDGHYLCRECQWLIPDPAMGGTNE